MARCCLLATGILTLKCNALNHVCAIVVRHQHTQCSTTCSMFTFGVMTCWGSLSLFLWKLRERHVTHKWCFITACQSVCSSSTSSTFGIGVHESFPPGGVTSPLGTNDLRVMHARDSLTQLAMSRKYAEWPQGGGIWDWTSCKAKVGQ